MRLFLDANVCLDLLDTTRPTSQASISWYMHHKDDADLEFYFSGDFITTFYYVLTERKNIDKHKVVHTIDVLTQEIRPFYLNHSDFIEAKNSFHDRLFTDFEDLMILHSALRLGCGKFLTNDRHLGELERFGTMEIESIQ